MPTDANALQQAGQALASIADSLSATFARELARVLLGTERALTPLLREALAGNRTARSILPRALQLRTELRTALKVAGYDALAKRASVEAVAQMADVFQARGLAAEAGKLGRVSPVRLQALAKLFEQDLLGAGQTAAHQTWRAAAQAIYSQKPATEIVAELAQQLEKSFRQAQTIFDTHVSVVGRQIEAVITDGQDKAYLFVGPLDARTRDWCLDHVGRVYTKPAIDGLDNGQLPNVFLTGGGYNCRHSFLAVSDPALVALADTGERAPGYDGRVQFARALKAQRDRLRKAA